MLTSRVRADVSLPVHLPCAEVVPEVVRLLGLLGEGAAGGEGVVALPPGGWAFGRLGEPPLRPERTLAQSGVLDGDVLYLTPAARAPGPMVVEDVVEAVAQAVDRRDDRWTRRRMRRFLAAASAALLGVTPLAVAATGRRAPGAAIRQGIEVGALAGAAVLATAALLAWRVRRASFAAAALALAALPWWGLAGLGLAAGRPGMTPPARVLAVAAALLAGAAFGAVAAPAGAGPCLAVAIPAGTVALGAEAVLRLSASPVQVAAVVAVLAVPLVSGLPHLAMRLAGIDAAVREDAELPAEDARSMVDAGYRLIAWLLVGTGVTVSASLVVLVRADGLLVRCLAGVVAVAVGLRARAFRSAAHVLPLAASALAGVVTVEVALARHAPAGPARQAEVALLLLGTAAGCGLAALLLPDQAPSPLARRRVELFDTAVNLLLAPLCLGAVGLYGMVAHLARRLAG